MATGAPVFKWILKQRNKEGGFEGTQDTIVGLEALASYGENLSVKNGSIEIVLKTNQLDEHNFSVNKDNALVLQIFEVNNRNFVFLSFILSFFYFIHVFFFNLQLQATSTAVQIKANGHGMALLQFSYSYNLDDVASVISQTLTILPRLTEKTNPSNVNLEVCIRYKKSCCR